MLEELGLGGFNIGGTVNQVYFIAQIILLFAIVGGLAFYIMFIKQFKHKFRIKEVINGRKVIYDDKAREYKDSDGVTWWQLYKKKEKMSMPPAEAIEIDNKGRKCVEAYRTESGEYIFALDKASIKDVPRELLDIKNTEEREKKIQDWKDKNKVVDAFQPYTTKQRLIMIAEHKKALAKKTKKWQDYIIPVVGISAITIIVVSLMVFYGDMGKPLLEMGDKLNANQQVQLEQLQILQEIKNNVQTLKDDTSQTKGGSPPN